MDLIKEHDKQEIVNAYIQGMRVVEISKKLHHRTNIVIRVLREKNVKIRKTTEYPNNMVSQITLKKEQIDKIINLYFKEKKSMKQVAELTGNSTATVNKYISLSGIKPRTPNYFKKGDKPQKTVFKKGHTSWMKGKHHTLKTKQLLREKIKDRITPKKDTSIEVKIQKFLEELKIEFYKHKYVKIKYPCQCDIFIPEQEGIIQKTIIECDGDYWHGNPKYKCFKDYPIKIRCKRVLDFERTNQLEDKGFRVLRLWEHEIRPMQLNEFKEILYGR